MLEIGARFSSFFAFVQGVFCADIVVQFSAFYHRLWARIVLPPNEKVNVSPPKIEVAAQADYDRTMATILMGFASDPLMRWFWPDAGDYLKSRPCLEAMGGNAVQAGSAYVGAGFEGAALWLPPGAALDEERVIAFIQQSVAADRLGEVFTLLGKMDEYHPDEDLWYLPLIAVDPVHQGKGIGSALMKTALQACDATGYPAYLESSNPRNISLYERHGFEAIGQIQEGNSPLVTPMIRPASPS